MERKTKNHEKELKNKRERKNTSRMVSKRVTERHTRPTTLNLRKRKKSKL